MSLVWGGLPVRLPEAAPSRRSIGRTAALLASLILGVVSCAEGAVEPVSRGEEASGGASGEIALDPDAPLGVLGTEVQDALSAELPFVPIQPTKDGATVRQFVYVPAKDPSAATSAFVYQDPAWGSIVLLEYPDSQSQDSLLKEEANMKGGGCSPVPGYEGAVACSYDPYEPVDLGEGVTALVGTGDEVTSLIWVAVLEPAPGFSAEDFAPNHSLTIEVMGDASMFSLEEAVEFGKLAVGS